MGVGVLETACTPGRSPWLRTTRVPWTGAQDGAWDTLPLANVGWGPLVLSAGGRGTGDTNEREQTAPISGAWKLTALGCAGGSTGWLS